MPNWCENKLEVNGFSENLKIFAVDLGEPATLDFNTYVPYPEKYAKMDAEEESLGYKSGGSEWCIANWGTKWNVSPDDVSFRGKLIDSVKKGSIKMAFVTAWSPPSPVVVAMSKMYPSLIFVLSYREDASDFSGEEVYQNGTCISANEGSYNEYRKWSGWKIQPRSKNGKNKVGSE